MSVSVDVHAPVVELNVLGATQLVPVLVTFAGGVTVAVLVAVVVCADALTATPNASVPAMISVRSD